jgi:hypothetical protein
MGCGLLLRAQPPAGTGTTFVERLRAPLAKQAQREVDPPLTRLLSDNRGDAADRRRRGWSPHRVVALTSRRTAGSAHRRQGRRADSRNRTAPSVAKRKAVSSVSSEESAGEVALRARSSSGSLQAVRRIWIPHKGGTPTRSTICPRQHRSGSAEAVAGHNSGLRGEASVRSISRDALALVPNRYAG